MNHNPKNVPKSALEGKYRFLTVEEFAARQAEHCYDDTMLRMWQNGSWTESVFMSGWNGRSPTETYAVPRETPLFWWRVKHAISTLPPPPVATLDSQIAEHLQTLEGNRRHNAGKYLRKFAEWAKEQGK